VFETIADFFGGLSDGQMWAGALVCALCASLVAFWLDRYQGVRRISWSEVYNGPINKHINHQPPPGMWEIHWQGRQNQLSQIFTEGGFRDEDGRMARTPVAVVRADGSGTRNAFEERVTGGQGTPPAPRCTAGSTGVCSVGSTMELLDYVNRTKNAIGYAEANALPFFPNVRTVPINGTPPAKESVLDGDYLFWASEVLYTRAGASGLTRNFLDFLRSRGVSKLLEGQGFLPCRELRDSKDEAMRCA
jgi:hypothetical protein